MTEARDKNLENQTMPIIVKPSTSKGQIILPLLMKPMDPGRWADHYDIDYEEGGLVVKVILYKNKDELPRPSYLEFSCSSEQITAVGFSECSNGIENYQRPGPCGGCFFLVTDLTAGSNSAIVENWGHKRENGQRYHFGLWLKTAGPVHSHVFDPQIYNDGTIHQPPPTSRRRKPRR